MSFIKSAKVGSGINCEFPDKKIIFVRGKSREQLLYVVESLLAMDMSGYYAELDKRAGREYTGVGDDVYLMFNDGAITASGGVVQLQGLIPKTHVIRYIGVDTQFRSFYLEQNLQSYSSVYTDMRKYSKVIDDAKWFRLITTVNDLLGFTFVELEDDELKFHPSEECAISTDGQKLIYMLMAESYLTPEGYKRVMLISDIPYLEKDMELKLIKRLGAITGLSLILSTADVEFSDIANEQAMTILTV